MSGIGEIAIIAVAVFGAWKLPGPARSHPQERGQGDELRERRTEEGRGGATCLLALKPGWKGSFLLHGFA
ncbi:hypothetical protein [Streptomyces sp. CNQ085]|uniref:hypothetical protein n=1 Tax=Streptomyces sp. CNQ085 TaxID=2886944 RepID=UPI001F50F1E5|nr:hypothetical protein [Streptomyces sp. CNQ085]MCI0383110.1 hypothetical protein [Streptomyces sp. CNQ085]